MDKEFYRLPLHKQVILCRAVLKVTQKQLAEMIGINPTMVSKFEANKHKANNATQMRYRGFINKTLKELTAEQYDLLSMMVMSNDV